MFCPKCGDQNPDKAQFCKKCGASLSSTQNTYTKASFQKPVDRVNTQRTNTNFRQKNKVNMPKITSSLNIDPKNKTVIISSIAIISIILLALFISIFPSSTPEKTVTNFFSEANNIRSEKDLKRVLKKYAYEEIDASDEELIDSLGSSVKSLNLKNPKNLYKLVFFFNNAQIRNCTINNDTAYVDVDVEVRSIANLITNSVYMGISMEDANADKIIESLANDSTSKTKSMKLTLHKVRGKWKIGFSDSAVSMIFGNLLSKILSLFI